MARSFSAGQAQRLHAKLRASVDLDQEITLSPDECYVLLTVVDRLSYQATKRSYGDR